MIRVVVVDDHPVVLAGLSALIAADPALTVVEMKRVNHVLRDDPTAGSAYMGVKPQAETARDASNARAAAIRISRPPD